MGEFSPDWLSLREPFDHAARSLALLDHLHLTAPVRVVDLACGQGSSLRYLAPRLPKPQHWTLIDHDPILLARALERTVTSGVTVTTQQCDLQADIATVPLDADLIVTSALLDLVSRPWLEQLADRCITQRLPLLAALSVDGRITATPSDPGDSDVMRWFRAHQRTDRGFGPSPGVTATDVIAGLLEAGGMTVYTDAADWDIGPRHPEMLAEMIRGIAAASAEVSPRPEMVARWRADRLAAIARSGLHLRVGHRDLLAIPAKSHPRR